MADIELKLCPFCGGAARRYFGPHDYHGICCQKCTCKIYGYGSKAAVAKAWNGRKTNEKPENL